MTCFGETRSSGLAWSMDLRPESLVVEIREVTVGAGAVLRPKIFGSVQSGPEPEAELEWAWLELRSFWPGGSGIFEGVKWDGRLGNFTS